MYIHTGPQQNWILVYFEKGEIGRLLVGVDLSDGNFIQRLAERAYERTCQRGVCEIPTWKMLRLDFTDGAFGGPS